MFGPSSITYVLKSGEPFRLGQTDGAAKQEGVQALERLDSLLLTLKKKEMGQEPKNAGVLRRGKPQELELCSSEGCNNRNGVAVIGGRGPELSNTVKAGS